MTIKERKSTFLNFKIQECVLIQFYAHNTSWVLRKLLESHINIIESIGHGDRIQEMFKRNILLFFNGLWKTERTTCTIKSFFFTTRIHSLQESNTFSHVRLYVCSRRSFYRNQPRLSAQDLSPCQYRSYPRYPRTCSTLFIRLKCLLLLNRIHSSFVNKSL